MNQDEHQITCPFCWQVLNILVDPYQETQTDQLDYIEDCQVCCNPILIRIMRNAEGGMSIEAEQGQ